MPARSHESPYTAPERLYLDAAGKVVKEDDPNRQTLLVDKGGTLSATEARRYGLTTQAETPAPVAKTEPPAPAPAPAKDAGTDNFPTTKYPPVDAPDAAVSDAPAKPARRKDAK